MKAKEEAEGKLHAELAALKAHHRGEEGRGPTTRTQSTLKTDPTDLQNMKKNEIQMK